MTLLTPWVEAFKALRRPPAQKNYYPISSGERWIRGGLTRQARLYDSSRYSIAMAYLLLEPVRACIDTYANVVTRIPYRLVYNETHDPANDQEIAASTDVGKARHEVIEIFRNHRRRYHISFMQALMYEYMLYDMMLTELVPSARTAQRPPILRTIGGVRVLRGVAVTLQGNYQTGEVDHFYYSGDGGKTHFEPDEVAYDHGYNPEDDYEGSSLVESVLSELNIMEAFQRYLQRHLRKADRPDVYASFAEAINATEQNQRALRDELERYRDDPRNTIFVGGLPLNFIGIPSNDLNNQLGIDDPMRKAIYRAFGVPLAMVGDTTETGYKEGDEVYAAWVKNGVTPRLANLRDYLNDSILPAVGLDATYRMEFDTSEFDIVTERDRIRSEVVEIDVRSGLLSIGQARKERGYDDDVELNALYMMPDGTPVPRSELFNLWRYRYQAPALLDTAQATEARATADQREQEPVQPAPIALDGRKALSNQREAFAYIPLSNHPVVLRSQRALKERLTDPRIKWEAAPTLHVTLCYATLVSDAAIANEMAQTIRPLPVELQGESLDIFNTPNGKALHIRLGNTTALTDLQANVYSAFEDYADGLSEYSLPSRYKPHITLAYLPNDMDWQTEPLEMNIQADTVAIGRDDYDPVVILKAPEHVKAACHTVAVKAWTFASAEDARQARLSELRKWRDRATAAKARPFTPNYLRGDIGDAIAAKLASGGDPNAAFDAAFATFRAHDIDALETAFVNAVDAALHDNLKSLSTLETDFKLRFNPVVDAIRSGEVDNRRRAGSILRQVIRVFIPRAFIEGLRDGGVFEAPDDDEEQQIAALIREQSKHVSSLTDQLINRDGITDEQFKQKAGQWFRKSIKPAYYAGFEAAAQNQMMEFVGNDGLESCPDCKRLKGQRHRLKDWKRKELRPQVDTANFECGGFECQHELAAVAAKARGRW